jgi:hypothetical protein
VTHRELAEEFNLSQGRVAVILRTERAKTMATRHAAEFKSELSHPCPNCGAFHWRRKSAHR